MLPRMPLHVDPFQLNVAIFVYQLRQGVDAEANSSFASQQDTRVVVVDTRDHILSTFDRALSMYADEEFKRQGIDVIHNSRVRAACHSTAAHLRNPACRALALHVRRYSWESGCMQLHAARAGPIQHGKPCL